ncbi:hypothetical protein [Zobellia sp. B3R18]|uniref:hypothetical protein n=1 Tax=Zobellia sp. B3R18 TaxID=2841568 RepID=UPI001C0733FD|nr:hypothetical protein [Zobellia sp. B3R18]MBU2975042.1 hypothetical protein [Zobellia sp. B3R18]
MKSLFTKLFLLAFVSMTAFSCSVKSELEDIADELEEENNNDARTEVIKLEDNK